MNFEVQEQGEGAGTDRPQARRSRSSGLMKRAVRSERHRGGCPLKADHGGPLRPGICQENSGGARGWCGVASDTRAWRRSTSTVRNMPNSAGVASVTSHACTSTSDKVMARQPEVSDGAWSAGCSSSVRPSSVNQTSVGPSGVQSTTAMPSSPATRMKPCATVPERTRDTRRRVLSTMPRPGRRNPPPVRPARECGSFALQSGTFGVLHGAIGNGRVGFYQ